MTKKTLIYLLNGRTVQIESTNPILPEGAKEANEDQKREFLDREPFDYSAKTVEFATDRGLHRLTGVLAEVPQNGRALDADEAKYLDDYLSG